MLRMQKKLKQFKFDLIVLDVMMPGQNGYDFTKEIKKNTSSNNFINS